jgi:hypothetical protein
LSLTFFHAVIMLNNGDRHKKKVSYARCSLKKVLLVFLFFAITNYTQLKRKEEHFEPRLDGDQTSKRLIISDEKSNYCQPPPAWLSRSNSANLRRRLLMDSPHLITHAERSKLNKIELGELFCFLPELASSLVEIKKKLNKLQHQNSFMQNIICHMKDFKDFS